MKLNVELVDMARYFRSLRFVFFDTTVEFFESSVVWRLRCFRLFRWCHRWWSGDRICRLRFLGS